MTPFELIDAALHVAMYENLPVFGCRADKSPATAHGFKDATRDPDTIRTMFARLGVTLIGVPTGAVTGLLVLDIDPDGLPWYEANKHRLPPTRTHKTRRGLHLLFRHVDGVGISAGKIAPGVDVRGDGGYVIWWPAHGGEVTQ